MPSAAPEASLQALFHLWSHLTISSHNWSHSSWPEKERDRNHTPWFGSWVVGYEGPAEVLLCLLPESSRFFLFFLDFDLKHTFLSLYSFSSLSLLVFFFFGSFSYFFEN
jgi:hypothetical protein